MIKISAGYSATRQAHLVVLGLSDGNLHNLLVENLPIHVTSEMLDLPDPGFDIILIAAADRAGISRRLRQLLHKHVSRKAKITVLDLANRLYVAVFSKIARQLYIVGLTQQVSYPALRRKEQLQFRARMLNEGTPVEVVIFWGPDEATMEEEIYASGLIGPDTKTQGGDHAS